MSLFVKICGLTTPEAVTKCVELDVDAVGFVFAESPRRVTPEQAARLARGIPASISTVAVFRRPRPGEIASVVDRFEPDLVQADHEFLPSDGSVNGLPVFRQGIDQPPTTGRYLYEGVASGVGEPVDWEGARQVAKHGEMILAGGLNSLNVADAIDQVRPFGVDVSSGVESSPGVKDPKRIGEFVDAARSAAGKLMHI